MTIIEAHDEAYKIYTAHGQCAVHDAVKAGKLPCDNWAHCVPCETESPMLGGACLVCGEKFKGEHA